MLVNYLKLTAVHVHVVYCETRVSVSVVVYDDVVCDA